MKNQIYEENNYQTEMSMHEARIHFSLRSRMFKCKMNFLNTPKFKADMWFVLVLWTAMVSLPLVTASGRRHARMKFFIFTLFKFDYLTVIFAIQY